MAKGIRALLDTVMQALPQVGNLGLLFFLLFFIFAALGVEMFGRLGIQQHFTVYTDHLDTETLAPRVPKMSKLEQENRQKTAPRRLNLGKKKLVLCDLFFNHFCAMICFN